MHRRALPEITPQFTEDNSKDTSVPEFPFVRVFIEFYFFQKISIAIHFQLLDLRISAFYAALALYAPLKLLGDALGIFDVHPYTVDANEC